MTVMRVEVLGGYPRSDRLRRAMRRAEELGESSWVEVTRVLWEDTVWVLGVQAGAGMTALVDGMMDWHDPLRPFVEAWRGVYYDGLLRWFDNNFFYRIPVFVEEPDAQRLVLAPRVLAAAPLTPADRDLKVVLPGPATFVKLSRNRTGRSDDELLEDVARLLAREVEYAVKAGATVVQVDEPILGDVDADEELAEWAVGAINRVLRAAGSAETRLAIPYQPPPPDVYQVLVDQVEADVITVDFADNPQRALELVRRFGVGDRGLGVGVVQARDIYPEPYGRFAGLMDEVLAAAKPRLVVATTSAWLDLIPMLYAVEKTRLLGQYARRYASEKGISIEPARS